MENVAQEVYGLQIRRQDNPWQRDCEDSSFGTSAGELDLAAKVVFAEQLHAVGSDPPAGSSLGAK